MLQLQATSVWYDTQPIEAVPIPEVFKHLEGIDVSSWHIMSSYIRIDTLCSTIGTSISAVFDLAPVAITLA